MKFLVLLLPLVMSGCGWPKCAPILMLGTVTLSCSDLASGAGNGTGGGTGGAGSTGGTGITAQPLQPLSP